jgi:hypothetical protein
MGLGRSPFRVVGVHDDGARAVARYEAAGHTAFAGATRADLHLEAGRRWSEW